MIDAEALAHWARTVDHERHDRPGRLTGAVHQEPRKTSSPRHESIVGRNQASQLAASQPQRAFDLATTIPDGWYRAQAMATIAMTAPEALSQKAFREASAVPDAPGQGPGEKYTGPVH